MAGYLKQQTDCNRLKEKEANQGQPLRVGTSHSYTPSQASGNHTTELSTIGHINPQWRLTSTFDFTQIVNNYALKQIMLCHMLKFVFHFSQKLHMQF